MTLGDSRMNESGRGHNRSSGGQPAYEEGHTRCMELKGNCRALEPTSGAAPDWIEGCER